MPPSYSISFKGFNSDDPVNGLSEIIKRGGIFTILGKVRKEHGSLLQFDGLEKTLRAAGLSDQWEPRELLDDLKQAVATYASLEDALTIIGDRTGFLIQVKTDCRGQRKESDASCCGTLSNRFLYRPQFSKSSMRSIRVRAKEKESEIPVETGQTMFLATGERR